MDNKKSNLSNNHWIVKSNSFNEVRNTPMTITQFSFLAIYLSKINPKDLSTRNVEFRLDDYCRLMNFKQLNMTRLIKSSQNLLRIILTFLENTGKTKSDKKIRSFVSCQLFKQFKLYQNENSEWIASIDCHDDVLPFIFDMQKHFLKYQLWNILHLASFNQQRMYEILKQYEFVGAREITVEDLREFLGIKPSEYPRWNDFKKRVLDTAQIALAKHTDIKFTWEVVGKRGQGGKVLKIKFNIEKNEEYENKYAVKDFFEDKIVPNKYTKIQAFEMEQTTVETSPQMDAWDIEETVASKIPNLPTEEDFDPIGIYAFLSGACNEEFGRAEIAVLHANIRDIIPYRRSVDETKFAMFDYLDRKYKELNYRSKQTVIKNRFAYLKRMLEADREEMDGR
ncbi:MAG: replication initiation protein [Turicibacter sp.]|nr:replication initiation protein [Turicibacter sp.]